MSFASETKKELVQIQTDQCCAKAELSALIRMNGVISLSNKGLSNTIFFFLFTSTRSVASCSERRNL